MDSGRCRCGAAKLILVGANALWMGAGFASGPSWSRPKTKSPTGVSGRACGFLLLAGNAFALSQTILQFLRLLDQSIELRLQGLALVRPLLAGAVSCASQGGVGSLAGVACLHRGFHEDRCRRAALHGELGDLGQGGEGDEFQQVSSFQWDDWEF